MQSRASRPHMPEYGILGPQEGRGLLPWSWARERLEKAHNYWVSSVRPDGTPHAMAVWGVWLDGAFYFSTGRRSRKARNLARNARCVVCTERADEAVIVEGTAEEASAAQELERVRSLYEAKYEMGYPPDSLVCRVRPGVAFGFIEHSAEFAGSATRWRFE